MATVTMKFETPHVDQASNFLAAVTSIAGAMQGSFEVSVSSNGAKPVAKRGRPKKVSAVAKRKPGRPRKNPTVEVVKRKPGRPRKNAS